MNVFDNITATKHVVAQSTLIKATLAGHLYNVKIDHVDAIDNGAIISKGEYVAPEYYKSVAYSAGQAPLLVLSVPRGYNSDRKYYNDECYFYNAKGEIARCYELVRDDVFTVSAAAITALADAPVIGNFVTVDGDGMYVEADSDDAAASFHGEILEKVTNGSETMYRIRVIRTGVTY